MGVNVPQQRYAFCTARGLRVHKRNPNRGPDVTKISRTGRSLIVVLLVGGILAGCGKSSNPTDSGDAASDASRHSLSYFTEITHDVGLDFVHENGAAGSRWLAEISPSGVALFDFDNDGDLDIYFTNGHRRLGRSEIGGGCMNRLFRQEDDGRFADVSLESLSSDAWF